MSDLKIRLEKEIQNLGEFHQKYNNLKAIYEDMRRTLEVVKVQTRLFLLLPPPFFFSLLDPN